MSIISKTNQRYLTGDNQCINSLKDNSNGFFRDFATLEQKNRIENGYFNSVLNNNGTPPFWTSVGVTNYSIHHGTRSTTISVSGGGYLRQSLDNIGPGESYTAIIFCTNPGSGTLQFGVYAQDGALNQLYDVNNTALPNSSYDTVPASSNSIVKTMVQFSTNSTSVTAGLYVEIKNNASTTKSIEVTKVIVYKGLVELEDVMDPYFVVPPSGGDPISAYYGLINCGATAGPGTVFTLPNAGQYAVGTHTLFVFLNKYKQIVGTDYVESNVDEITMLKTTNINDTIEFHVIGLNPDEVKALNDINYLKKYIRRYAHFTGVR